MPVLRNVPSRQSSKQQPSWRQDGEWVCSELMHLSLEPGSGIVSSPGITSPSPLPLSYPAPELPSLSNVPFAPRPSHARRRKEGHIPRPPNAFMLFRSNLCSSEKIPGERNHRNISRIAGQCWKQLTPAEQLPYHRQATMEKQLHALRYPDYKYAPVYRKVKGAKRKTRKDGVEEERCRKVASLLMAGIEGAELEQAVKETKKEAPPLRVNGTSRMPELASDRSASPFVPNEFVPPLDLSVAGETSKANFAYDLQPPRFDPHYAEPYFGLKSQVMPFELSLMLCTPHSDETQDMFRLGSPSHFSYESGLHNFLAPDPTLELDGLSADLSRIYLDTTPSSPTDLVSSDDSQFSQWIQL